MSGALLRGVVALSDDGIMLDRRLGSGLRALGPWSLRPGKVVSATVDGVLALVTVAATTVVGIYSLPIAGITQHSKPLGLNCRARSEEGRCGRCGCR